MPRRKRRHARKRRPGLRQLGVQHFTAVRSWFRCSVYPERHPKDEPEIIEHFFTTSNPGGMISYEDVLDSHDEHFAHHETLEYEIGRLWHYM